jgi:hypothetical protein
MPPPPEPGSQETPLALENNGSGETAPPDQMISDLAQSLSGFDGLGGEPPNPEALAQDEPMVLPVNLPNQAPVAA